MNIRFLLPIVALLGTGNLCAQHLSLPAITPLVTTPAVPCPIPQAAVAESRNGADASGVYGLMKSIPALLEEGNRLLDDARTQSIDTLYVGLVPNDTMVITGNYLNNGPVFVFNDGVLIFYHADATIMGNIYVFQNGQLLGDSSTIHLPQQYFYQRSMIAANNGIIGIAHTTLDFGGLSHNLVVTDQAVVGLTEITNMGFTTAGVYSHGSVYIDGSNQAGEFIMTDSAYLNFNNAATVLLWHHVPDGAVIDVSFPPGASVAGYAFNNTVPGVSGIGYSVQVTSCTDVMWALMPEDGSNVTITGSALRAIGLWFTGGDTVAVSGLVNNSTYSSFTAPLPDRNLQLNNTTLQTWSLYMFDTAQVNVTGCIVGEVGSMGRSYVVTQSILCDGSGGYYWATDTTLHIAIGTTVLGTIRSQGSGILLLGYGAATAGGSAIENAVLVVTQSSLPQDPVAFEHAAVWRAHINPPTPLFVDTLVDISGTAFIDQGPLGSFLDFGSWAFSYAPAGTQAWIPITSGNTNEVHNGFLTQWNTAGLAPGQYDLRLNTFSNFGDSIDAVLQVTLLPSILGIDAPNASSFSLQANFDEANGQIVVRCDGSTSPVRLTVYDSMGRLCRELMIPAATGTDEYISFAEPGPGVYYIRAQSRSDSSATRLLVTGHR